MSNLRTKGRHARPFLQSKQKRASSGAGSLSHRLWGIKINPTRWWSHYQIKSQLNSVDMRGGIEGRLFPDSAERCDRSIQGKKRAISLTCPQLRVNGLIPPIEITAPDCTHQMLSCITLERQQLDVYPIPLTPPFSLAFVSCAALYYPWWKYNLPLICVPKPYKSKSSKVATFLHRYYVAPPSTKKD